MGFDLESIGTGFGTGIIGAILGVLGINRRVNRVEEGKQDKISCLPIHKGIDDKFIILIDGQKRIFERLDSLNDYLRNGDRK